MYRERPAAADSFRFVHYRVALRQHQVTDPSYPRRPSSLEDSTCGQPETVAETRPGPPDQADPWHQVRLGLIALFGVLAAGTVAYTALGLAPFDAFYQTLITISTVGYTEVGANIGGSYRVVSAILILLGVGVALYTLGFAIEALMAGQLRDHLGRARLQHTLDALSDHIVLCGFGQVGQAITRAVQAEGLDVVVVDRQPDQDALGGLPAVIGQATDDDVLKRAGIDRARGLIVALNSDADNTYVVLSGRALNPGLFIVARANDASAARKLAQAGADRVVNPHEIGGNRMAAFMLQPNVADLVGESMQDGGLEFRVREFTIDHNSRLDGTSIGQSGLVAATGVTVLAVRRRDGSFVHEPVSATAVYAGDIPIVVGTLEQHAKLRSWLG